MMSGTPRHDLENPDAIAGLIDHTLLKPEAKDTDITRLCDEARQYKFASVCVNPCWVPLAAKTLSGSGVQVCTTIGFPLGANATLTKFAEGQLALSQGATELDMVLNVGALRSRDFETVQGEIVALAAFAHLERALLKVILETCLLDDDQKVTACRLATAAKADFVKTSTGFSSGGATVEDVRLMRKVVGHSLGVKASGGIRSLNTLRQMVAAGANRIGTSSGVAILRELNRQREPEPLSSSGMPEGGTNR